MTVRSVAALFVQFILSYFNQGRGSSDQSCRVTSNPHSVKNSASGENPLKASKTCVTMVAFLKPHVNTCLITNPKK